MTAQTILKSISFEEFVAWYPEDGRYELIDGIVTEMQPTGEHEDVTEFIATSFTLEVNRLQLPFKLPRRVY
ncbi:MAG: Uma2 family endonuclease [Leptolyngbya sp. Prado105]|jgi:Uma2 family endonuclease|nr:Uma2 family endonuclease [Leptolyngbya sp. Prado105]